MIVKEILNRNNNPQNRIWISLNYDSVTKDYFIRVGYFYTNSMTDAVHDDQKIFEIDEFIDQFPEYENVVIKRKLEIEDELNLSLF